MTDPKQFALLLTNSSLPPEEKVALLKLLPLLDIDLIEELAVILKEDVEQQEAAISETEQSITAFFSRVEAEIPDNL